MLAIPTALYCFAGCALAVWAAHVVHKNKRELSAGDVCNVAIAGVLWPVIVAYIAVEVGRAAVRKAAKQRRNRRESA